MRHYEIMLLIHPDQSERARVMMDRYVGIIEGGQGQVHRNEDLGRRMLAYPIAKVQKAHYMLLNVECGQDTLDELVGALHFSDAV
ncbi:MAG: 30S ribosomal protein S6, partial [Gammaproteobacteria bacterium]|nr:30S ribosomal protein S6 [Gammaproteobacteria bacterium]